MGILDFKEVPNDRRVPLVATKFWGQYTGVVAAVEAKQSLSRQVEDQKLGETIEAYESGALVWQLHEDNVLVALESSIGDMLCGWLHYGVL